MNSRTVLRSLIFIFFSTPLTILKRARSPYPFCSHFTTAHCGESCRGNAFLCRCGGLDTSSEALNRVFLMVFRGDSSLCILDESLQRFLALLLLCSFCPFGRSKIADGTHISETIAGNWEKFSTSNKRTSARPHWSRYRLCAKLRKRGQAESIDEMMLRSRAWLLLVME